MEIQKRIIREREKKSEINVKQGLQKLTEKGFFLCDTINKCKRIRSCLNCQRFFHLSCVGLTKSASVYLVV